MHRLKAADSHIQLDPENTQPPRAADAENIDKLNQPVWRRGFSAGTTNVVMSPTEPCRFGEQPFRNKEVILPNPCRADVGGAQSSRVVVSEEHPIGCSRSTRVSAALSRAGSPGSPVVSVEMHEALQAGWDVTTSMFHSGIPRSHRTASCFSRDVCKDTSCISIM